MANKTTSASWETNEYEGLATDPQQELLEEGFAMLARSGDPEARMPQPEDPPQVFARKRNAIINRIVPIRYSLRSVCASITTCLIPA